PVGRIAELNDDARPKEVLLRQPQGAKAKLDQDGFKSACVRFRDLHEEVDVADCARIAVVSHTAYPPTIKYCTSWEFNNSVNSRRSVGRLSMVTCPPAAI